MRPYVEPFFDELPRLHRRFEDHALVSLLLSGFPQIAEQATVDHAQRLLTQTDLDPVTRTYVANHAFDLSQAVAARKRFATTR